MANTYKLSANKLSTTGSTVLYTAPAATTTLVKSLYISNVSTGSVGSADVIINKSGSVTDYYLIQSGSIPVQTSFQPISDPIVLETGDSLKVNTQLANVLDTLVSYLEIT